MIRVVLADDHSTVRQGLRLLVGNQPDMEVVGDASDGRTAITRVLELRPTVAVVDVSMPEMNGLAATREIRKMSPDTAIVALTRYDDDAYVQELMAAGAIGYVLKQSAPTQLLAAIRAAARGARYVDPALGTRVSTGLARRRSQEAADTRISPREAEVLRRIALGHSNREIATELTLSIKTVEAHKSHAMRKLGLSGRVDIVRFAILQGWLDEA